MFLTQEDIVNEIAKKERVGQNTIRRILKKTGDIVFENLSSTPPQENILIRPFSGLSITRSYCPKREYNKGMFKAHQTSEKVKVRADVSKYYNNCINNKLFTPTETRHTVR